MPHGFTIVETMIFLAISSLIFLSAILLVSGQQAKTEFLISVKDTDSQIQQLLSNVSAGFYSRSGNFKCADVSPSGWTAGQAGFSGYAINISPPGGGGAGGLGTLGTSNGCTFIGEVIQFSPSGNPYQYVVYPMVGREYKSDALGGLTPVKSLADADPTAVYSSVNNAGYNLSTYDGSQTFTLPYGLKVNNVTYLNPGVTNYPYADIGIFTSFVNFNSASGAGGNYNPNAVNNNSFSGAESIDVLPIPNTTLSDSQATAATKASLISAGYAADPSYFPAVIGAPVLNPSNGLAVCFQSEFTSKYAVVSFSSTAGQVNSKLDIYTDKSTADAAPNNPSLCI